MDSKALSEDPRITLVRPEELNNHKIYKSDFNSIYDEYFRDFVLDGTYAAAPSGVLTSYSVACKFIPSIQVHNDKVTNYIIDDNYMSVDIRKCAYNFMRERDQKNLDFDEVTISPSVSHATGILMIMLKNMGIKDFYCVAPAYFSIIEQALYFGFNVHLLHGCYKNNYYFDISHFLDHVPSKEPYILFLFSPRYPLGDNIDSDYLNALLANIDDNAFVIFDEAQDRSFPAVLRNIQEKTKANIFRVFGIFKSLGLHGAKTAIIQHPKKFRKRITEISETIGGTLDKYSALVLSYFSSETNQYIDAIKNANLQILNNFKILLCLMDESYVSTLQIENGFLGGIIIKVRDVQYLEFRRRLLEAAKNNKIPLAIGSTQFFPYDGENELIRINYFQRQIEFEKSILLLNRCLSKALLKNHSEV